MGRFTAAERFAVARAGAAPAHVHWTDHKKKETHFGASSRPFAHATNRTEERGKSHRPLNNAGAQRDGSQQWEIEIKSPCLREAAARLQNAPMLIHGRRQSAGAGEWPRARRRGDGFALVQGLLMPGGGDPTARPQHSQCENEHRDGKLGVRECESKLMVIRVIPM